MIAPIYRGANIAKRGEGTHAGAWSWGVDGPFPLPVSESPSYLARNRRILVPEEIKIQGSSL